MESRDAQLNRVTLVARQMGSAIRRDANGRTGRVKVAERNEGRRHVWRFQSSAGAPERFLHIAHRAMVRSEDSAARLLDQLSQADWADRLFDGSTTSLMLSPQGRLRPWPKP